MGNPESTHFSFPQTSELQLAVVPSVSCWSRRWSTQEAIRQSSTSKGSLRVLPKSAKLHLRDKRLLPHIGVVDRTDIVCEESLPPQSSRTAQDVRSFLIKMRSAAKSPDLLVCRHTEPEFVMALCCQARSMPNLENVASNAGKRLLSFALSLPHHHLRLSSPTALHAFEMPRGLPWGQSRLREISRLT